MIHLVEIAKHVVVKQLRPLASWWWTRDHICAGSTPAGQGREKTWQAGGMWTKAEKSTIPLVSFKSSSGLGLGVDHLALLTSLGPE